MIISEIIGGLGNQMFQYAAALSLAHDKNTSLKLDVSGFSSYPLHQGYELERVFGILTPFASEDDVKHVLGWQRPAFVKKILRRQVMERLRKNALVFEPDFSYFELQSKVSGSAYISGYWQSEKYFSHRAQVIKRQFEFKPIFSPENEKWAALISGGNSVGIHVRRGDFLSKKNISIHGACSVHYYSAAIKYISERISDTEFFIFSDDLVWAQNNIAAPGPCHFIANNTGAESFNDLRLMSLCKHNVIANSSFSWWGAWLNANISKIVIAPAQWFVADLDTRDLIPSSWVTL